VSAFEGNKAETKTMLPVIEVFMAAHDLPDVTVRPQPGRPAPRPESAGRGVKVAERGREDLPDRVHLRRAGPGSRARTAQRRAVAMWSGSSQCYLGCSRPQAASAVRPAQDTSAPR
jgi:hypothetical protein